MRVLTFGAAILGVLLATAAARAADDGKIVTDRPDAVESSDTVGRGRFQIETSFAREWTRKDQATGLRRVSTSTPTLLRFGIVDDIELRIETNGRIRTSLRGDGDAELVKGWADAAIGLKWKQQDGDIGTGRPDIAWLVHADLASGSRTVRGNGLRPSVRMVAEFDMPEAVAIGVMPGVTWDKRTDGKREVSGILAVVVGKEWSDKVRTFAEIALPRIATARNGGNVALLNLGIDYWIEKHVKVDLSIQRGLNRNTPDWGGAVGFSIKF